MRVTRHQHHKQILFDYSIHNQTFENVQSAKYLGITITDNMDWGQHVSEISSKVTKTLGFLRRNLAYKTLVWPKLEYAAPIRSPHLKLQINQIEKVQRTAVRWTCRRWRNRSSVGEMLDELELPSFEAGGTSPPCFFFTRFIVEQCLLKKTSIWPLHTVWKLPGHHIVLNTADTRHTVMSWRIPFSPELFHIRIVCLILLPIPSPQRSSGFCGFFYFIKISKFALPGVMLKLSETSNDRKKETP